MWGLIVCKKCGRGDYGGNGYQKGRESPHVMNSATVTTPNSLIRMVESGESEERDGT